jgi:squalene-hopene/tetraprenyl-beta-curcumene cyclase
MLAVNDGVAGTADPRTTAEFDRVWSLQRPDGSFYWLTANGMLPFLERDGDYVTALVALGAGYLPKSYRDDPKVAARLAKTVAYLLSQPAKDLHAELILTWAAARTPGLADSVRTGRVVERLRLLQRSDGGWSLPSFGSWKRHDGAPNDPIDGPSDGYATGLATFVLCQAAGAEARPTVERGLRWLETNQRASGRWFTRSLYSDRFQHYLSTMGTAYAVMALEGCRRKDTTAG